MPYYFDQTYYLAAKLKQLGNTTDSNGEPWTPASLLATILSEGELTSGGRTSSIICTIGDQVVILNSATINSIYLSTGDEVLTIQNSTC